MTPSLLLFGASGGIARALISRCLADGWNVMAVSRDPARLEDLPDSVQRIQADATQSGGAAKAFDAASCPPAAVVNCIGSLHLKSLARTTAEEFTQVMRVNVFSSFQILQEAAKRLPQGGSVVLMSSVAAQTGLVNHETIGAAKAAVEGLARSAAASLAPKGIRVNAVAPGLTETPMTRPLLSSAARAVSEKMHPLGRVGRPSDIAAAIAWLIDPANSWTTGQILHVDGGLGALRCPPGA